MEKQNRQRVIRDTIFIILMAIAIVGLIICIVLFIKYKDIIGKEPIQFALKEYNFSECTCRNPDGKTVKFTPGKVNVIGGGDESGRYLKGFGEV